MLTHTEKMALKILSEREDIEYAAEQTGISLKELKVLSRSSEGISYLEALTTRNVGKLPKGDNWTEEEWTEAMNLVGVQGLRRVMAILLNPDSRDEIVVAALKDALPRIMKAPRIKDKNDLVETHEHKTVVLPPEGIARLDYIRKALERGLSDD